MPQANQAGEGGQTANTTPAANVAQNPQNRQAEGGQQPAPVAVFDGQRAADIVALCQRHNLADLQADLLRNQSTMDQARAAVLTALDQRSQANASGPTTTIRTVGDEHETRMRGIENALMHRLDPGAQLDDNGRQYRSLSLVEMAREVAEGLGQKTRGMSRAEIVNVALRVRSGMLGTGTFLRCWVAWASACCVRPTSRRPAPTSCGRAAQPTCLTSESARSSAWTAMSS